MKLNNLKSIKMKKFLFTIVATVLMSASLLAQNVAKECVLIEAFTGIRCGFCPAAAGGVAEMLKQGLSVAPLAFHCNYYSEEYATPETDARGSSFYKVQGYPTVVVDGVSRPNVGGSAGQYLQSYNALKAEYDKRINIESPFTIELTYDYHSWNKCEAKAVVKKVGECAGDDVRVFIALTESHVPQNWGGWSELNAVVRDVVTSTAGAKLVGETSEITALFDVHQWKKENCELVAWVQNTGSNKEVYQAVKISIATEPAQYDLGISKIENVPTESCSGIIKPTLTIKNHGSETLTSALLKITDEDNNDLGSYKWEGSLKQGAETAFDMPEIRFNTSYINVEATELNGISDVEDKYTFDNNFKYLPGTPYQLPDGGKMIFQVKTSEYENFSIDIINMDKEELIKTITFTDNNVVKEEYILPEEGCYRVIFKNSAGNGVGENSFWGIIDGKKKTVVSGKDGENEFTYQYVVELAYGSVGVEDVVAENVEIYPNPAKSVLNVNAANLNKVTVFNSIGQVVYVANANSDEHVINVESWSNGLYYINLETNDGVISSQKVIVNK
ncbi:MAG: T9SS type A sorting domain-containing protein [Lentimicrobiaceae bacterium]|nr:T9SS type A sorting domain-containing protein [Lentimicrobiaceae bacterium]